MKEYNEAIQAAVTKHFGASAKAVVLVREDDGNYHLMSVRAHPADRLALFSVGHQMVEVEFDLAMVQALDDKKAEAKPEKP